MAAREGLLHACAGSTASAFAMLVFYPLETVRLRMQIAMAQTTAKITLRNAKSISYSLRSIVDNEGVAGLYVGLRPTIVCITASNFVYFFIYTGLKSVRIGQLVKGAEIDAASNAVIATVASVINVFVTCPLWVVGMQMKVDNAGRFRRGMVDCLKTTVEERGWESLFEGLWASLWLICTPIVQYVAYEQLKQLVGSLRGRFTNSSTLWAVDFFIIGAVAKLLATLATYPMQVVQAVLRTQNYGAKHGPSRLYPSTFGCLAIIYAESGIQGLCVSISFRNFISQFHFAISFRNK